MLLAYNLHLVRIHACFWNVLMYFFWAALPIWNRFIDRTNEWCWQRRWAQNCSHIERRTSRLGDARYAELPIPDSAQACGPDSVWFRANSRGRLLPEFTVAHYIPPNTQSNNRWRLFEFVSDTLRQKAASDVLNSPRPFRGAVSRAGVCPECIASDWNRTSTRDLVIARWCEGKWFSPAELEWGCDWPVRRPFIGIVSHKLKVLV